MGTKKKANEPVSVDFFRGNELLDQRRPWRLEGRAASSHKRIWVLSDGVRLMRKNRRVLSIPMMEQPKNGQIRSRILARIFPQKHSLYWSEWCRRSESNRHELAARGILSPVRLPVSPLRHENNYKKKDSVCQFQK